MFAFAYDSGRPELTELMPTRLTDGNDDGGHNGNDGGNDDGGNDDGGNDDGGNDNGGNGGNDDGGNDNGGNDGDNNDRCGRQLRRLGQRAATVDDLVGKGWKGFGRTPQMLEREHLYVLTSETGSRLHVLFRKLDSNSILALLSPHRMYRMLEQVADFGCEVYARGGEDALLAAMAAVVGALPVPPTQTTVGLTVTTRVGCELALTVDCCDETRLGPLLAALAPCDVVHLVTCILTETPIVFTASSMALLPAVSEALLSLVAPLAWPFVYIPILPPDLLDCVEAPTQFILGVLDSALAHKIAAEGVVLDPSIVVVDLAHGRLRARQPTRYCGLASKRAAGLVAHLRDAGLPRSIADDHAIRAVFHDELVDILNGYRDHYVTDTSGSGSDDGNELVYDFQGFVTSRAPRDRGFAHALTNTQMFYQFVADREAVDEVNAPLAPLRLDLHVAAGCGGDAGRDAARRALVSSLATYTVPQAQLLSHLAVLSLEVSEAHDTSLVTPILSKLEQLAADVPALLASGHGYTAASVLAPLYAELNDSRASELDVSASSAGGLGLAGPSTTTSPVSSVAMTLSTSNGLKHVLNIRGVAAAAAAVALATHRHEIDGDAHSGTAGLDDSLEALPPMPEHGTPVALAASLVRLLIGMFKGVCTPEPSTGRLTLTSARLVSRSSGVAKSGSYTRVCQLTGKLVMIADDELVALSHDERAVFFLNLHNALAMHACIALRAPTSSAARAAWSKAAYLVGSQVFNLLELEHAVLRNASALPSVLGVPFLPCPKFKAGDARAAFALSAPVRFLDFGLAAATRSSAPVRVFDVPSYRKALRAAFDAELAATAPVLPRVLQWYGPDYHGEDILSGRLGWARYDWSFGFCFESDLWSAAP
ncbi:uncharacterized protein AMSG_07691 [Thecamonas trahens ATCC 50062]|uniref:UDENN domain-containing protein n=1 Tax=Thecamonas trahens ATCC 50062 TaxID=461836 RepID=A0A0L0DGN0_THETB|nr:hypothetical protein AMSG_07691 [Thecamonas trahens ATCC 50062]KNC51494.1 hypothetical protein AMSG_07691 [Thecamonas trahens ATCC 50062]|eukprot:XP_013756152.1 hypothetical protein AMSG_07691 [Thecamonas trahens ATCC 50062]